LSIKPTVEQQAIIDASRTGDTVAISAGAGTGKTSTLRLIAEANPDKSMLYVAFNKAIQQEADGSFPPNVTAKTAHSLAYREFGAPMRQRLGGPRLTSRDNARVLGIIADFGFDADHLITTGSLAAMTMHTVARFCRSADPAITVGHAPYVEGLAGEQQSQLAAHILPFAHRAWQDLTSPSGRLKPSHDVYLKQFALSNPQLTGWDVILYDEAQDADPCIAGIVAAQSHAQLIAVGDSAQAIYGWRGAGDFVAKLGAAHRLVLTQSWRFGQAVAEEGNSWLEVLGTGMRITGNPARTSKLDNLANPDAILCRSNAGTVEQLLKAHETGTKVYLEGGGGEIKRLAEAAQRLQNGQRAFHPELVAFKDWSEVIDYAEKDPGGSDLAVGVKLIEQYGADEVTRAIDGTVRTGSQAELVVSTAHKSKGLEWDQVRIATDFKEPLDKKTGQPLPIPPDDAMLAYVAVTRAKDTLDNTGLAWIHGHMDRMGQPAGTRPTASTPTAFPSSAAPVAAVPSGTTGQNLTAEVARARKEGAAVADPVGDPARYLGRFGLAEGMSVLVAGERGKFRIRGVAKDGSLTCYGEGSAARSFPPEWCTPANRNGRGGKQLQVRSVPESAKAARAAWRQEHSIVGGHDDDLPVIASRLTL
jgi:hypothetical protein